MSFMFVKVEDCDLEQYKKDMQEAFQKGFEEDFGKTEEKNFLFTPHQVAHSP